MGQRPAGRSELRLAPPHGAALQMVSSKFHSAKGARCSAAKLHHLEKARSVMRKDERKALIFNELPFCLI